MTVKDYCESKLADEDDRNEKKLQDEEKKVKRGIWKRKTSEKNK